MTPELPRGTVHRYQGWEYRVDEHELLVRGQRVKIGRPACKLLLALIEADGRLVSKDDLFALAWPNRVVSDKNLSVQLTKLRAALGSNAILNVSGLGYRLAAARQGKQPGPSSSALIGRDADLAEMLTLMERSRLVSIVGTGGVGKTSLARAAFETYRRPWRDGTHWIDLTRLSKGAPLGQMLARTLGVVADSPGPLSEDLILLLSQLDALVVLDNSEHLLDEVATLIRPLISRALGIHFLITSQEPLRLEGESVYRLAPLEVPRAGAGLTSASSSGALALLQGRVSAINKDFKLQPETVDLAIELCRHLDGLPLAIEIAAAPVATLGLQAVFDQIDQRLRLRLRSHGQGGPERHDTLLQTYEWSYGLLSTLEQQVFRRLEPFAGGFSAQMAQQLCCGGSEDGALTLDGWEMLEALSALVEKSLVQSQPAAALIASNRLSLLESARDFARLQLAHNGETDSVRRRHAEIVADAFELANYELERWRDRDWAAKYGPERSNVGVALNWACAQREPSVLARLTAALAQMDSFALSDAEVVRFPIPLDVLESAPMLQRARACLEFGWAHYLHDSRELGTRLLESALEGFEALGDDVGIYCALTRLIRMVRGRPGMQERAEAMWARLKQIDERQIPPRSRLRCSIVAYYFEGGRDIDHLWRLHRVAQGAGFDDQANACLLHISNELLLNARYEEAAAAARGMLVATHAGAGLRALAGHNLALALVRLERFEEAREAAQVLLRALPGAAHMVLDLFAWVALRVGRVEHAALMAGRSAQVKRDIDWFSEPAEAALIAETASALRDALETPSLNELMQIGAALSTPEALSLAQAS
ncbi:winged helix-turn-helix domain-containing protein [Ideonella sp. YS5]|uniref:winged helix-turn-helix domain-containing protein n=1 Tax=Ideonella sp. YS5 TaxID=3453714 RepID=UPI003EEC9E4C